MVSNNAKIDAWFVTVNLWQWQWFVNSMLERCRECSDQRITDFPGPKFWGWISRLDRYGYIDNPNVFFVRAATEFLPTQLFFWGLNAQLVVSSVRESTPVWLIGVPYWSVCQPIGYWSKFHYVLTTGIQIFLWCLGTNYPSSRIASSIMNIAYQNQVGENWRWTDGHPTCIWNFIWR